MNCWKKCFFFLCLFFSSSSHVHALNEEVFKKIDQLIQQEVTEYGTLASVSVRSSSTGEIMYEYYGNRGLRPASNLKLLTAASVLETLGEEYTFDTDVVTDGKKRWKLLNGNLYLKGRGDPALTKAELDMIAQKLHGTGISVIKGNIILDDTWYDDVRLSIDLPWSDETTSYGAQVSALTLTSSKEYDAGTIRLRLNSYEDIGEKATVELDPHTDYVTIKNNLITINSNDQSIHVERRHGTNVIEVSGWIGLNQTEEVAVSVWEPTDYVGDVFKHSLKEQGITVLGEVISGTTPSEGTLLLTHKSRLLSDLLHPFLTLSHNGYGEIFVKEMGKKVYGVGSWECGLAVMETVLEGFGLRKDRLLIRDGSGLSHINSASANDLTKVLYEIQQEEWYRTFVNALPKVGYPTKSVSGTLKERLNERSIRGKIRAKTGTLTSVTSLSGYIETQSGECVIFSVILNNKKDIQAGKQIEDKLVRLLVNS